MSDREFDLCGPLPEGVTVLEASAGTGKTYTIAGLAARYVAGGMELRHLLLVTFTRMATGELRERVRERLVAAERGLDLALAGGDPGADDVVRLLAAGTREEVTERRRRLSRALADFDAATIATTHGFCQEVLGGLGVAGDVEDGVTFVEDLSDLVEEVVDDLFVRRFHHQDGPPAFSREEAGRIAHKVVGNPGAALAAVDGDGVAAMRRRFAEVVCQEVDARKRRRALLTYDDLLTRLAAALRDDTTGVAVDRLRRRFRVVLVDEFQDTDPVQWEILRKAFGAGDSTLVLIGDPKQAIYAFRGADVYAYLDAAATARGRATLQVNWRSDQGLIDAYDALFGNARLGHPGIVYREVRATEGHRAPRLGGAPVDAPLRVRVVGRDEPGIDVTRGGFAGNASAREHIARDLAADLVRLLDSGADVAGERIRPGHVAVLVRRNRDAAQVRDALAEAGVPAVINGAGSVFATTPARDWLRLLEALERPASAARARSAALTPFLGWSTERVASAADADWEEVHRRLHQWARVLRVKGVAALMETITLVERLPGRVLGTTNGERDLTDLRHVAQLLHAAATTEHLGVTALAAWLRRRIAEALDDNSDEERSRRLESDDEAVQVLTIHRSKGLEFPIVYFPSLWEPSYIPKGAQPVDFHDPDAGDRRTIDVSLEGGAFARNQRRHREEQRGEDLRLAYVALTRARHQAVVWWAPSWDSRHSPLGRLLFFRDEEGHVRPEGSSTPTDEAAWRRFEALAAQAPGRVAVERSTLGLPASWSAPREPPPRLDAAAFDRDLDWWWRRTSYSDITAGAHDPRVASEPEEDVVTDVLTSAPVAAPAGGDAALRAVPSPLAGMPVGVQVGTLVHRVFEAADFAAPDLDVELSIRIAEAQAFRAVDLGDAAAARAGLAAAIEAPLGPLLGGLRLRDVTREDRLDELEFELPLAGGDEPAGRLTISAIAAALREHLPAGDPLAAYADRLDDAALRHSVRGYLTGSIDLVVRVPGPDGPRFAVVDYKTNWLAPPGEELTLWHYRPEAVAAEMRRAHYGLQALLYVAALHRYLRWRLPGYDPERHLAGVLYLFVRGMSGPDPQGVFGWAPPAGLVEALSDALDGRVAA